MRSDTETAPMHLLFATLRTLWRIVCVPVYTVLAVLEPFVRVVFSALAFLGICTSIMFKFLRPEFPFWTMLAISLSFAVALVLYYGLMRLVTPR